MLVRMIPGYDPDGLLIPKWRDALMRRGAEQGELTIANEEVEKLRRSAIVAHLKGPGGKDLVPPLVDVVVRYAKDEMLTLSGVSEDEPMNRWHAQA